MKTDSIYVVDGARTPFLKSKNRPGPFGAADLATQAGRTLLARQKFAPDELDEVILGCAAPSVDEVNIGRVAALRMGCGQKVPGWTVMRNCASGMQALDSAISNILAGKSELVLAGGVDALSRAPLLYNDKMVLWFSDLASTKTTAQRIAAFGKLPVRALLAPVIGIMKGLTDPMVGLLMGQTAENLAQRFGITREMQDAFSVRSHQRVISSQKNGYLAAGGGEVEALFDTKGNPFLLDDGVRADASVA
ncbi:MAG TPA: beta-ketoacyl synthase N-terminal-like domain-containing protein, partial [Burkholderiales bacterium]|nr:beta-ketoacyl synthase N-terminal-like domain-containing protein [Burkholderiales bacterium]